MKHFEACIGDKWMAWDASETCSIKKSGKTVTIKSDVDNEQTKTITQIIDLSNVPMYAFY